MNYFLILCMVFGLMMSQPYNIFAQNQGVISDNQINQTTDIKQSQQPAVAAPPAPCEVCTFPDSNTEYTIGVGDVININVLKPEELSQEVTVAPDGMIAFPYIGSVKAKGRTIEEIQNDLQTRLADGYMKYPVVSVSLKESLSRNFFVYGEVVKPGSYPMAENMTVMRAISMAGGFTRFGSSSRVKVLRVKRNGVGYEAIMVNINNVMNGNSSDDVLLEQGDIVTVSEGVF